jgi:hypothetical protein
MVDGGRLLVNTSTGKSIEFGSHDGDRRICAFKARLVALQRYAEANRLTIYFLTLTLAGPNSQVRLLNGFLNFLRARFARAKLPFKYCWVLELQEKRYEETGVFARHWHIAIACPLGTLPNVEYIKSAPIGKRYHLVSNGTCVKQSELYEFWGYGQELCQLAKGSLVGYMSKYMAKNLEAFGDMGRRFGSSVMTWWRISRWAFELAHEFYQSGLDIIRVWFTRGELARLVHIKVTDGEVMETYTIGSPWRVQDVGVSEAS